MAVTPIWLSCRNYGHHSSTICPCSPSPSWSPIRTSGWSWWPDAAAADREIEAAAVSELAHPGPWLQGGELLLTIGLLLPDTVDGCRTYLAELDAAGVRAVGLGLGAELPYQAAPERLVVAADAIGMPLLTVPTRCRSSR